MKKIMLILMFILGSAGIAFAQSEWSAVPINKTIVDNQTLIVEVEFRSSVDAQKNHTRSYEIASPIDIEVVKREIAGHVKRLQKIEDIFGKVAIDAAIDLTPAAPDPPTQAELDRLAFIDAHRKYIAALRAVDLGYIQVTDPMFVNAKTDAQNKFQASYWQVIYNER